MFTALARTKVQPSARPPLETIGKDPFEIVGADQERPTVARLRIYWVYNSHSCLRPVGVLIPRDAVLTARLVRDHSQPKMVDCSSRVLDLCDLDCPDTSSIYDILA